jgi:hypothetical protein
MKQIGAEIGVNESRVSQLHARAIGRLRKALAADRAGDRSGISAVPGLERKKRKARMAKARLPEPIAVVA